MRIEIASESLVKLLKPSLFWDEAELIACVMDDKFETIAEPYIEDIEDFVYSITLVKKRENAEEYNAVKLLFKNNIKEPAGTRFDFIYDIDEESEVAICGVNY